MFVSVFSFSFQCVLMLYVLSPQNKYGFFFFFFFFHILRYQRKSLFCSIFGLLCYVGAVCVLCVCVLIIAFSHQISTKRGQVGTVPINLLIIDHPEPPPLHTCETQNTPRVNLFNQILCPPSQDAWDMTVTPSLYPFVPFRNNNYKQSQYLEIVKKTILGMLPHNFQKTKLSTE